MWKWGSKKKRNCGVKTCPVDYDGDYVKVRGQQEFNNTMQFLKYGLMDKSMDDQILILDYVAELVKKDLQYDLMTKIIYECFKMDFEINYFFPSKYYNQAGEKQLLKESLKKEREIDLASDAVVLLPWELDRTVNQILNIAKNGFEYQPDNHWARYYTDLDICYVHNGNHSCGAGIGWQKGKIMANVVDMSPVFECIDTNGAEWIQVFGTPQQNEAVEDFRLAILYKVIKMEKELEKNKEQAL